jgi:hypothetical protein
MHAPTGVVAKLLTRVGIGAGLIGMLVCAFVERAHAEVTGQMHTTPAYTVLTGAAVALGCDVAGTLTAGASGTITCSVTTR